MAGCVMSSLFSPTFPKHPNDRTARSVHTLFLVVLILFQPAHLEPVGTQTHSLYKCHTKKTFLSLFQKGNRFSHWWKLSSSTSYSRVCSGLFWSDLILLFPPSSCCTFAMPSTRWAVAVSGGAVAVSGGAVAVSAGAVAVSGGAVAVSGGAVAVSDGAGGKEQCRDSFTVIKGELAYWWSGQIPTSGSLGVFPFPPPDRLSGCMYIPTNRGSLGVCSIPSKPFRSRLWFKVLGSDLGSECRQSHCWTSPGAAWTVVSGPNQISLYCFFSRHLLISLSLYSYVNFYVIHFLICFWFCSCLPSCGNWGQCGIGLTICVILFIIPAGGYK